MNGWTRDYILGVAAYWASRLTHQEEGSSLHSMYSIDADSSFSLFYTRRNFAKPAASADRADAGSPLGGCAEQAEQERSAAEPQRKCGRACEGRAKGHRRLTRLVLNGVLAALGQGWP